MRKYLQAIRYKCIFAVFLTLSRFWIWFIFWLRKSFEQALLLQKKWIGWGEKYGSIGKKIGRENSHLKPCIYFLVHNFAFKITFVTVFCCNDPHICSHISFWKFLLFHVCYGQSFLSTSKATQKHAVAMQFWCSNVCLKTEIVYRDLKKESNIESALNVCVEWVNNFWKCRMNYRVLKSNIFFFFQ